MVLITPDEHKRESWNSTGRGSHCDSAFLVYTWNLPTKRSPSTDWMAYGDLLCKPRDL